MQISFYDWCLSQYLPNGGYKFTKTVTIQHVLKTTDDSDIGYAVDVKLKSRANFRKRNNIFPIFPKKKMGMKHFSQSLWTTLNHQL